MTPINKIEIQLDKQLDVLYTTRYDITKDAVTFYETYHCTSPVFTSVNFVSDAEEVIYRDADLICTYLHSPRRNAPRFLYVFHNKPEITLPAAVSAYIALMEF